MNLYLWQFSSRSYAQLAMSTVTGVDESYNPQQRIAGMPILLQLHSCGVMSKKLNGPFVLSVQFARDLGFD